MSSAESPNLSRSFVDLVLAQAKVPEHSLLFMQAMSGGVPKLAGEYLFFHGEDWLMAVAYPLRGVYAEDAFHAAFYEALRAVPARKQGKSVDCWAIGANLPQHLLQHTLNIDTFYTLHTDAVPPVRLRSPLARAKAVLRVDENRIFTSAHRRLWAEFMSRTALRANVKELYARTETALNLLADSGVQGDLRLLNAWDAQGNLAACLVLDYSPADFVSYIIGAHSREHPAPYASDLLFAHMLEKARQAGKKFIHLGLGVNSGILRFKKKWGAVPALPYTMAAWTEEGESLRETATALFQTFLHTPANLSKREMFDSFPEQRPLAMLWELQKNGKRSWIAGSAHFFCCSFESNLRDLFSNVDTVLFEGSLDQANLDEVERIGRNLQESVIAPAGHSLTGQMREEEIRNLEKVVQGPQGHLAQWLHYAWKNPADVRFFLQQTRHWCALFSIWTAFLERSGWRESVDLEAWKIAKDMDIPCIGMETLAEQIAALEAVPDARILYFFRQCRDWKKRAGRNVTAYLAGDLENMCGTSAEFPTHTETIISQRDYRFLERMLPFLEEGRCAVFAGSAHMLNLRTLLQEKGFTLQQVQHVPWQKKVRKFLAAMRSR